MIKTPYIKSVNIDDQIFVKEDYLNHPIISGNKLRKLKYNLLRAKELKTNTILTFGGAYSNHIFSVAAAGKEFGFNTIGVIRGEELSDAIESNNTLKFAQQSGMNLIFISRSDYKLKNQPEFIEQLRNDLGDFYLIPEGGTNEFAIKGCEEILTKEDEVFDYICCPVGTGGTISGIINSSFSHQKILGFSALKGDFLLKEINNFVNRNNWDLITDYHFGGYAKINQELISFINEFKQKYGVPLDPIYTGKMMFGVFDLLKKGYFEKDKRILVIHTGGLQSIESMNKKLEKKNLLQIV